MPVSSKQRLENISKQEAQQSTEVQKVICVACNDTGVNSRGGLCVPCQKMGRIEDKPITCVTNN